MKSSVNDSLFPTWTVTIPPFHILSQAVVTVLKSFLASVDVFSSFSNRRRILSNGNYFIFLPECFRHFVYSQNVSLSWFSAEMFHKAAFLPECSTKLECFTLHFSKISVPKDRRMKP